MSFAILQIFVKVLEVTDRLQISLIVFARSSAPYFKSFLERLSKKKEKRKKREKIIEGNKKDNQKPKPSGEELK